MNKGLLLDTERAFDSIKLHIGEPCPSCISMKWLTPDNVSKEGSPTFYDPVELLVKGPVVL